MFTIESTPDEGASFWMATESPIVFGLQRKDTVKGSGENEFAQSKDVGGFLTLDFSGNATTTYGHWFEIGQTIIMYDDNSESFIIATVTDIQEDYDVITDQVWVAGTDILFVNGNPNPIKAGYYFQAQLTINDVVNTLLIKASPNVNGYAEIDVAPILRTVIAPGKSGAETGNMVAENNKSGRFEVAFKECWYGSSESFIDEENVWLYAEFVRSASQGGNLEEYTRNYTNEYPSGVYHYENPFCNLFEKPIFWKGLPFSISMLQGVATLGSPAYDETVTLTIRTYSSDNTVIDTEVINVTVTEALAGRLCSLNIPDSFILSNCAYFTLDLTSQISAS